MIARGRTRFLTLFTIATALILSKHNTIQHNPISPHCGQCVERRSPITQSMSYSTSSPTMPRWCCPGLLLQCEIAQEALAIRGLSRRTARHGRETEVSTRGNRRCCVIWPWLYDGAPRRRTSQTVEVTVLGVGGVFATLSSWLMRLPTQPPVQHWSSISLGRCQQRRRLTSSWWQALWLECMEEHGARPS